MESIHRIESEESLSLESIRLFIPPLRLLSAAMWSVVREGHVQSYGLVEDFIHSVTNIVPELISTDQRTQILLALRARAVLELFRVDTTPSFESIDAHLEQIKTLISSWAAQPCFQDVVIPESTFVEQVQLLLKDPMEKETFFKDVFPIEFGPDFDNALQFLMLDFLKRLEKLFPIPDIQQTASMLRGDPTALDQCLLSAPNPQILTTVLQYHTSCGHLDVSDEAQTITSFGNCILSSLCLPQVEKVLIDEQMQLDAETEQIDGCVTVQVEGQTVTLLDYIQIEQPTDLIEPDDRGESEQEEDNTLTSDVEVTLTDDDDAFKPAPFQPLKQSKQVEVKNESSQTLKGQRRKYSTNKTCPICDKTFLRAAAMRRHLETHSVTRELKYKCDSCDKRFRDQYDMTRHSMRVHEKEAVGSPSSTEGSVDPDTSPSESKNCILCGKYFARIVDMERHMKSHLEDRPYSCLYCKKTFKNSYILKRHQNKICKSRDLQKAAILEKDTSRSDQQLSPGEGKECPICCRVLPCSADIAKHLRSHTEERPFICLTCEKGFKYRDTLKKHQIIHGHEGVKEEESKSVEQILAGAEAASGSEISFLDQKENIIDEEANTTQESVSAPQTRKKELDCPVCARTFNSIKTFNRHLQSHTEDRPYHCVHCKKRFKHMHGLKRHQIYAICHKKMIRFHWKKEPVIGTSQGDGTYPDVQQGTLLKTPVWCSNCSMRFESLSALKKHQAKMCKLDMRESLKCDKCEKEFKSMTLLKVHQRIHDPLYCKECGKILATDAAFERHKLMHRPMQCTKCEKSFTLLRRLREHYEKLHNFTGPYPCGQCDKSFMQLSYLAIHSRIHQGEFPYACDLCPEKFRSSNCLTVHQRKHTGEKPFLCWQCGKSYRSASELTVHMGTHSEERPWACTECNMAYRTKLQLTNHVEQVHIGVRYPCTICGKQFMKETSLKRHELIHTGERPHQCTVCGKTFLTANELRLHNRYHTGERPYKCEVCGKAFIQSGYLKSHMRIHTGEKPFKCDVCGKGFRLSYHMKKHKRIHAGKVKNFLCEECGSSFLQKSTLWEHSLTHNVKLESLTEDAIEFE